jgi:probable phosphoglycerate mutase
MSFVNEIAAQYPGKRILVVSHGFLMGQTFKGLMQDEATGNDLLNTSVTTIIKNGDKWEYRLYNCIKHYKKEQL